MKWQTVTSFHLSLDRNSDISNALHQSNVGAVVNIIGFDVDNQAQQQLKSVADAGGGSYVTVKDATSLKKAFADWIKELKTQKTAIGGLLGLVSGGVLGVGTKLLGIGAKSILTLGGASGVITSVVDDLIRGKKIGLKKAIVWGTLSLALAGVPLFGQSIGKYINPAKPAITASETQVGANVVKTSENSVASNLDKNELLRIMQTGEGNLYDLLKRAGVQPSFSSEDILAAKNVIMQYKPKDIMTGKIPTEGNSNAWRNANLLDELANSGVKYSPDNVLSVTKTENGKLVYKRKSCRISR